MNIQVVIGHLHGLFVKGRLDVLQQGVIGRPVVGGSGPAADDVLDAAFAVGIDVYLRAGALQQVRGPVPK